MDTVASTTPTPPSKGRRRFWPALRTVAPGFLSGILLPLGYAPLRWWWVAWAALIPLYVALFRKDSQGAVWGWRAGGAPFAVGYAFGFALFLIGSYWMLEIGSVPWVALSLIQAAPFALLTLLCAALLPRLPSWARPILFAALWTLFEAGRSYGRLAFPWFLLATSQVHALSLLQIVADTGQWGLSFCIALVNGLLGEAWLARSERKQVVGFASSTIALLSLLFVSGTWQIAQRNAQESNIPPDRIRTVGAAQGSYAKADYADPVVRQRVLSGYLDLSRDAVKQGDGQDKGIGFVAWPETVAPGVFRLDLAQQATLSATARDLKTPLIVGIYDIDEESNPWNSAVLYDRNGALKGRYDKNQLVPVGEFFPLRGILGSIYAQYGVPAKDLTPGIKPGVFTVEGATPDQSMRVGTIICYECVFPRWAREDASLGAQVIVLITSDETFGTSAGPLQHADIATLRAVETRRWLVRAAATGVSEFIDPTGKVRASLPLMQHGALTHTIVLSDERSLYVRFGDWFLWLCGLLVGAAIIAARRSGASAPKSASA